ncbi:hypothetical protein [Deinococcus navajonensis]|uniref:DoxX family membrane protein n=1 Tax=Deinococcus navajonensis TaxID=309884 RepID=A0ABV8XLS0_9DEIO
MRASSRLSPSTLLLAALFCTAGALHLLKPDLFDRMVPPATPLSPRAATLLSGVAELTGGLGLLHSGTRPAARWGLLALLLAVYPANLYMAQAPEKFGVAPWVAWARLPLQPLLMWWVWAAGRRP